MVASLRAGMERAVTRKGLRSGNEGDGGGRVQGKKRVGELDGRKGDYVTRDKARVLQTGSSETFP